MPYTPFTWINETPDSTPIKYTITDDVEGEIAGSATIEILTGVTSGTPIDSTRMNQIEGALEDVFDLAENIETEQLVNDVLSADATGRAKMADGFLTLAKLAADLRFQKLFEFEADGLSFPDWTAIPATFTNLVMFYNGLSTRETAGSDRFHLRVNNDSGSVYRTVMHDISSTAQRWNFGVTNPHDEGLLAGILPAQNAGFLPTGSGLVLFPNYKGTDFYKSCIHIAAFFGTYKAGMAFSNSYRESADPITRLTGYMDSEFPRAGSLFSLYGFG